MFTADLMKIQCFLSFNWSVTKEFGKKASSKCDLNAREHGSKSFHKFTSCLWSISQLWRNMTKRDGFISKLFAFTIGLEMPEYNLIFTQRRTIWFGYLNLLCDAMSIYVSIATISLHLYASFVIVPNGLNYFKWCEQVNFHLNVLDLDLALLKANFATITNLSGKKKKLYHKI